MNDLHLIVQKYAYAHGWDLKTTHTLLAVSGGVDSMAMAAIFHANKWPFSIAHVNYKLRGDESDGDAAFMENWAEQKGISCHVLEVNTQKIAIDRKQGIQETARQLRYEWFTDLLSEYGYDYLATAHHADDSIETALFNFARGSGLRGVRGIRARRGKIIRPLLCLHKSEIQAFAKETGLEWRDDSSNETDRYSRNHIRHHIIPAFEKLDDSFEKNAALTLSHLQETEEFVQYSLDFWEADISNHFSNYKSLDIEALPPQIADFVLFEILSPLGFNASQIINITEAQSTATVTSHTHELMKYRGQLLLRPVFEQSKPHELKLYKLLAKFPYDMGTLIIETLPSATIPDERPATVCFVDAAQVSLPLSIRALTHSDTFKPFGMAGKSKNIKKHLIDEQINPYERENVRLLINGDGNVIWVIGVRADERFKVSGKTKKVIFFKIASSQ